MGIVQLRAGQYLGGRLAVKKRANVNKRSVQIRRGLMLLDALQPLSVVGPILSQP